MQLIKQNEDLLAYVHEKCASSNESSLDSQLRLKELVEVALQSCENTYVVVDGLDECDEAEEKKTAIWFRGVLSTCEKSGAKKPHVLIVSQRDGILDTVLGKVSKLYLNPQDHQKDIEMFADHWTVNIQHKFQLSDAMTVDILKTVICQADGMMIHQNG